MYKRRFGYGEKICQADRTYLRELNYENHQLPNLTVIQSCNLVLILNQSVNYQIFKNQIMEGNFNNSCMGAYKDPLDIKLTDACNGDCGFCIEKGGKLSDSASVETFIEKVKSINPKSVLVLGGEPFIYPKLAEFIEGISGRKIFITTNGSRLKDKTLLERIAPHLTAVNISLMFCGMEKHFNATKVKLNPTDIKEGIEILQKHGVSVRINSILLKGYLDKQQISDAARLAGYAKL